MATCRPFKPENIHPQALKVTGLTEKQVLAYQEPGIVHKELCTLLAKYVNKFEKTDKFTPVGYNVRFDTDFLSAFFKKNEDKYYASWFNWKLVDPLQLLYIMDYNSKIALPNYKLATVCQHFGIPIKAHDAMSDIKATRELWYLLNDMEVM